MKKSGQPYALSLHDLLQVLGASSQSYQVRTDVPASLLPSSLRRGTFHAEVIVAGGEAIFCALRDQTGSIRLEGTKAFEAIRSHEQLIWFVAPYTPPGQAPADQAPPLPVSTHRRTEQPAGALSFQDSPFPWVGRTPPVRTQVNAQEIIAQLDRYARLIWLLVDGKRTVGELAMLLQVSQELVSDTLTELESRGLITTSNASQTERR